jgi:hypothetical protein
MLSCTAVIASDGGVDDSHLSGLSPSDHSGEDVNFMLASLAKNKALKHHRSLK